MVVDNQLVELRDNQVEDVDQHDTQDIMDVEVLLRRGRVGLEELLHFAVTP